MCLPCWAGGGHIERQLIKSHLIVTVVVGGKLVKFKCSAKIKSQPFSQSAAFGFSWYAPFRLWPHFKNKSVFSLRVRLLLPLLQFWVTFIMLPTVSFFDSNRSFRELVDFQSVPLVSFPAGDTWGNSVIPVSTHILNIPTLKQQRWRWLQSKRHTLDVTLDMNLLWGISLTIKSHLNMFWSSFLWIVFIRGPDCGCWRLINRDPLVIGFLQTFW